MDSEASPGGLAFLANGGAMGALMRAHDWSATPLGPPCTWPSPLRSAVGIMLGATSAMGIYWGTDLILLYNNAWRELIGDKHPQAIGRPAREVFPEIWETIGPICAGVMAGAGGSDAREQLLPIDRNGRIEEAWFDYSFNPILLEDGAVGGVLNLAFEVTARVRAEQAGGAREARQALLLALGDALRDLADPCEVMQAAAALLGRHLGADRVGYAEMGEGDFFTVERDWCAPGMPSLGGRHRLDDFGPALIAAFRAGRAVAFDDALTDPLTEGEAAASAYRAASTRAAITVPLLKAGRFAAALYVHSRAPRCWTEDDGALVHAVAERTGAAVERARAEAALREGEAQLRAFVSASSDAVYRMSADWREMRQLYGRGFIPDMPDSSKTWLERYIHPDDQHSVLAAIQEAIRTNSIFELEHRVRRVDGSLGWTLSRAVPLLDGNGRVTEWFGTARDVTARRQAVEGLRESEARFRHMADSAPALIWMTDQDGAFTFANMHFDYLFGRPAADFLGEGWKRILLPEEAERFPAMFMEAFHARQPFRAEVRVRDKDGRVLWLRCEGVPRTDDSGRFLGYTGCDVDITEARLTAEMLEQRVAERTAELMAAEATLRQAQKMEAVGQLTGGIAHDFNNMLQAISGSLDLMRRRLAQGRTEEAGQFADAAHKTVDRAAALTHRLLAFARRQVLQPRYVAPEALIEGLVELIRRTVGPAIVVVLRPGHDTGCVLCDPGQIENALLNLAINARDAMPEGGTLTIGTSVAHLTEAEMAGQEGAAPGDYVEIAVADTGSGMDEATRARAFEPFFTTKPIGQGTGLGLSQLYGFTRQSGGIVRLDSAPDQGTTVRLYLPRHERMAETAEPDAADGAKPDGKGKTVLLVEDEESVREVAAEHLRELGYEVLEAGDGLAALRLLHGSFGARIDVLVTDVGLSGGLNGRQVAEMVRERRPGLPVLFITGYAGAALEGKLAPGMAMITKPFPLDALAASLRDALA